MKQYDVSVLFVCLGNICRSPTAEGVFRKLVAESGFADRVQIDSAGTHDYHVGKPPDPRAQEAAARRGIDLSGLRGRQATSADFEQFDYLLAMDRENLEILLEIAPEGLKSKARLFLEFAPESGYTDVPDPYWGGGSGFERVLDLVEEAAAGLLDDIRRRHGF
jgi:protein-tyrosine phosphatase